MNGNLGVKLVICRGLQGPRPSKIIDLIESFQNLYRRRLYLLQDDCLCPDKGLKLLMRPTCLIWMVIESYDISE